ncbi:MAG: rhomboid family intramembrane serine protease [Pseudomonadota bacterium]
MIRRKDTKIVFRRVSALFAFMAAIWGIQVFNDFSGYGLNALFGLIPRHIGGVDGVLGMPFLHGSYDHLMSNTPPLLLMGGLLALTATRALIAVNGIIVGLGGALVWLFGETAIHVGASGLIFGWFGFLVARGMIDRSPVTLATSVLIVVIYGSIVWGMVPGQEGISWEAHLFGALSGVAAAIFVRSNVHAPRLRNVDQS